MPRGVYDRAAAKARRTNGNGGYGAGTSTATIEAPPPPPPEIEEDADNQPGPTPAVGIAELSNISNDAAEIIAGMEPYSVEVTLEGVCPILFHRWSVEGVEAKAKSAKGSEAKKTDDIESYVWRNDKGLLCLPGEYIRQSIIHAAKFRQDPRSPRKSMMDLTKAAIFSSDELIPILTSKTGRATKDWDFVDRRRVQVQRSGITRSRPAFLAGWRVTAILQVVLPEYIKPSHVNDLLQLAGKVVGTADNRPSYGRFLVTRFRELGAIK